MIDDLPKRDASLLAYFGAYGMLNYCKYRLQLLPFLIDDGTFCVW